jgi:hypothetical protein
MATVTCSGLLRVGRLAAPAVVGSAVPRPEGEEGRRCKLELERLKLNKF